MPKVSECSDLSVVETDIVPRINQLCLATTNAGVRVAALSAMAALAPRLPKDHALRSLSTISKVPEALPWHLSQASVMHLHRTLCLPGNMLSRTGSDLPCLHVHWHHMSSEVGVTEAHAYPYHIGSANNSTRMS